MIKLVDAITNSFRGKKDTYQQEVEELERLFDRRMEEASKRGEFKVAFPLMDSYKFNCIDEVIIRYRNEGYAVTQDSESRYHITIVWDEKLSK